MALRDPSTNQELRKDSTLPSSTTLLLVVGIGPLDPRSLVSDPAPFPIEVLPAHDVVLDVVVSTTHAEVAVVGDEAFGATARSRLALPVDGGPAVAPNGTTELVFRLRTPDSRRTLRVRVGYYFRDALVQSQILDASVGDGGGFSVQTDFTASAGLLGLDGIRDRPRLAVLLNAGASGSHQITIRLPSVSGGHAAVVEVAHEQLDKPLARLRRGIEAEEYRPTTKRRSRQQLIDDLRRLAAPGADFYAKLQVQAREVLWALVDHDDPVIHIARPSTSTFTLPWSFVYELPLPGRTPDVIGKVPICESVANWDGTSPLVAPEQRRCPAEAEPSHRNPILCPFGFWGFRYGCEVLTGRDDIVETVTMERDANFVALLTTQRIDKEAVADHLEHLRRSITALAPDVRIERAESLASARTSLGADIPLVYLLCHGERPVGGSPDTFLSIGNGEVLTPGAFLSWLREWELGNQRYWHRVRPLVFINACHSVDVRPDTILSYVEAFVGGGRAAGVIGTEATVHVALAMGFASTFFDKLATGSAATVGDALRAARLDFLAAGNLFGLLYSAYCWDDLKLAAAA